MAISATASIDNFIRKTGLSADTVYRKIAFDIVNQAIFQSPVDTGNFRSHWRVGVNAIDPFHDFNGSYYPRKYKVKKARGAGLKGAAIPATEVLQSANANIPRATIKDTIYITNRVLYGPKRDIGPNPPASGLGLHGGYSPQAPVDWVYNIVRKTAASYR